MDLVFTLVCNGELSLARVLRKNILDKVEQKKLLRYTNSLKPLAARGVSARYHSSVAIAYIQAVIQHSSWKNVKSFIIIWVI